MFRNKSPENILTLSHLALTNAMSMSPITTALERFNYPLEKLNAGMNLYTLAEQAVLHSSNCRNDQKISTAALQNARALADKAYIRHLKLARFVFQGNVEAWKTLGLDGKRARVFGEWLAQARRFYTNLLGNPALLAALLPYNLPETDLTCALTLLAAAENAYAARENARGIAIQATRDRDLALQALKTWVSALIAIARFALEDDLQLLESLGVVVK